MKKLLILGLLFLSFGNVFADNSKVVNIGTQLSNSNLAENYNSSDIGNEVTRKLGNTSIKDTLINTTGKGDLIKVKNEKDEKNVDGINLISKILIWFKNELTSLIAVLAIGVFIFIGFRIFVSRGNPEEFKAALMHFVYAVIGIFVIFIAWGAVKLVSSISL